MPVKLFVAESFGHRPPLRFIDPQAHAAGKAPGVLYKSLPSDFAITGYEKVDDVSQCDFIILPQPLRSKTPPWHAYFDDVRARAEAAGKRVIVVIGRDDSHRTHVDDAIVFKGSDYRHARHENEIIMAPFVEDLGEGRELVPREKGKRPLVSFCGYAGFPDLKTRARYLVKNLALDLGSCFDPTLSAYKRGIYFRRKAMQALSGDPRIATAFILRDSYGGNKDTARISPAAARREYIDSILGSDLVLAPKGDANFSARFFETLSLGRVPILIDTDMELPLEREIDYSSCILRVPHTELSRLPEIVHAFWSSTSPDKYREMQHTSRRVFRDYLRYDAYVNKAFPLLKERGVEALQGRA